jgi:hypothetical protein
MEAPGDTTVVFPLRQLICLFSVAACLLDDLASFGSS